MRVNRSHRLSQFVLAGLLSALAVSSSADNHLLEYELEAYPPLPSSIGVDQGAIAAMLTDRGHSAAFAPQMAEALSAMVHPDGVQINSMTATDALFSVLAGGVADQSGYLAEVESITPVITLRTPVERYLGHVSAVRQVPGSIAEGLSFQRDGQVIVVSDGFAITLAPTAADAVSFLTVVSESGLQARFRDNATFEVSAGDGVRFSGAFAYDNLVGYDCACGTATVMAPQGSPLSPSHTYQVRYENGVVQNVVPFADNPALYDSLRDMNIDAHTDRNTGVLVLDGALRLRPDFMVLPLSAADRLFHSANADDNGIAVRTADVNGDGIGDYEIISETGVQVFYGL